MAESNTQAAASQRAHRSIQWVLRGGLIISIVLVAAGLFAGLVTGEPGGNVVGLSGLWSSSALPDRLIAIGLVALAVTPILRVLALAVIWTVQRDRRFVALSLVVAAALAASLISGWRAR